MVKGKTFSVHPRTRRRGKQSVGHQVAKSVQKANAKQLKRQAKQEQKVQGGFRKAMSTFYERNLAEDREYVYKTLSEHEEWLPKLSAMFKSGALQSILEDEQAGPEEEINLEQLGRKIKGRACKLMNLPKHGKLILLQEYTNLENMDEADMADDWLNDAMTFLFHISSKTPAGAGSSSCEGSAVQGCRAKAQLWGSLRDSVLQHENAGRWSPGPPLWLSRRDGRAPEATRQWRLGG